MAQFDFEKWAADAGKKWGEAAKNSGDSGERKDAGTYVARLVGGQVEVRDYNGEQQPQIAWRHIILEGNYAGEPHYHWSNLGGDRSLEFLAKTLQRYEVDPAELNVKPKLWLKTVKRILKELVEEGPIVRLRLVDKPNPNDPDSPYQNTFVNKRLRDKEEEYAQDEDEDEDSDEEDDESDDDSDSDEDDEEDEEEEQPKKGKGKSKPAPVKGKSKKSSDDEDEEDDSDEESDDEDEEDDDEESSDDKSDSDEEEEDDDEEGATLEVGMSIDFKHKGKSLTGVVTDTFPDDEKVEVKVGKGKKAETFKIKLAAITAIHSDEDDEDEEEEAPKAKKRKK